MKLMDVTDRGQRVQPWNTMIFDVGKSGKTPGEMGEWLHLLMGVREAFRDQQRFAGVRHIAAEDMFLGDGFTEDDWRELAAHHFWRLAKILITPRSRTLGRALANSPLMDSLELLHIGRPGGFDCHFTRDGIDKVRAASSRNITFSRY